MGQLSTLVIGLGKIGMGYDLTSPEKDWVLSHSRAISLHPGYHLAGGVDTISEQTTEFSRNFKIPAYSSIQSLPEGFATDLVVIATPTETHHSVLREVLSLYNPRVVVCEKPLSYDFSQAKDMVQICNDKGIDLVVNFPRRADPAVKKIGEIIRGGTLRRRLTGVAQYGKGLIHNGSHLVDLLSFWFGDLTIDRVKVSEAPKVNSIDPSANFRVTFSKGEINVFGRGSHSNNFEIIVSSSGGTMRYERGGNSVIWDSKDEGGQFTHPSFMINDSLSRYQYNFYDELLVRLADKNNDLCSGDESLSMLSQLIEARDAGLKR